MEKRNVQAIFQMLDSFVKEFSINTLKKIDNKENLNIQGQLGFRIINIIEEENEFKGQIELINDIKIMLENDELAVIHIAMQGLFSGEKNQNNNREKFEDMLKINGATTLSHLIRAYVYTTTGLSGMPQITTPMINFVEFFKNAKTQNEEIK